MSPTSRPGAPPSRLATVATLLLLGLFGSACGSTSSSGSTSGPASAAASAPTPDPLSGSLTVFAAASLTAAFNDARAKLASTHSGLSVTYSFAGSQALVAEVQNGAPADVIATADTATMQRLVDGGLVEAPKVFVHNRLEIVVAPGNPKRVTALTDFARTDLKVVLEDPSVPAGKYGRQALAALNVVARPVSLPLDVKSELLAIEQGNADVGIVYVSDVTAAGPAVTGVAIPDSQNVVASYPIAVVRATTHPAAARAFVEDVVSGTGQRALRARGFLAP